MSVSGKLRSVQTSGGGSGFHFFCPGCQETHLVVTSGPGALWKYDGNPAEPTFSPSVLAFSGHHLPGHTGRCWCNWREEHPDKPGPFSCYRCHSFVIAGSIQFLPDCTHALAGKSVPLPDMDA